jgi:hypothetical protein
MVSITATSIYILSAVPMITIETWEWDSLRSRRHRPSQRSLSLERFRPLTWKQWQESVPPRPQLYRLFISHCHQQVVRLVTDRPSRLTSFSWDLLWSLLHKSFRKSKRPLSTRPLKPRRGFCEDEPWMRQGTKHIVTMNKRTRQIKLSYYDEINLDADGKLIPIDSLLVILSSDYPLS